jgi:hypothetical protein
MAVAPAVEASLPLTSDSPVPAEANDHLEQLRARLTHGGRRTPDDPTCRSCGTVMTRGEIAAYRLAFGPRPGPSHQHSVASRRPRPEGHPNSAYWDEAKRLYDELNARIDTETAPVPGRASSPPAGRRGRKSAGVAVTPPWANCQLTGGRK